MKSAKQTRNGAKTRSIRDAETAAKRTAAEAKAGRAVFKEAKAKLKLARKAAKNKKKAARKVEKAAARACKTLDILRKEAEKAAAARVKKTTTAKVASPGSSAPAKKILRRKALASLAPDSRDARPHPATRRPAPAPGASWKEPLAPAAVPPNEPESPVGEHFHS